MFKYFFSALCLLMASATPSKGASTINFYNIPTTAQMRVNMAVLIEEQTGKRCPALAPYAIDKTNILVMCRNGTSFHYRLGGAGRVGKFRTYGDGSAKAIIEHLYGGSVLGWDGTEEIFTVLLDKQQKIQPRQKSKTRQLQPKPASHPAPEYSSSVDLSIPEPQSAIVRHPKGGIELREFPKRDAEKSLYLRNGTQLEVLGLDSGWYMVSSDGRLGYAHRSWILPEGHHRTKFGDRHIQIKSFGSFADAEHFAKTSSLNLSVFLASNSWFAVTLGKTFDRDSALTHLEHHKKQGLIPDDSFVTLGNGYVRKVCCSR